MTSTIDLGLTNVTYTFYAFYEIIVVVLSKTDDEEAKRQASVKLLEMGIIDDVSQANWVCEDSYSPDVFAFVETE